jgi:hypothetical protein
MIEGGSLGSGTVAGGAGGAPGAAGGAGGAGDAFGNGLFIEGDQQVTLSPKAGETLTIAGVIADGTGSVPTAQFQGFGALEISGPGTVVLTGITTYAGNTTIGTGGTLELQGEGSVFRSTVQAGPGSVFDISGAAGPEHVAGLTDGAGGGAIALGSNTLLVDGIGDVAALVTGSGAIGAGFGGNVDLTSATFAAVPSLAFAGWGTVHASATVATVGGFDPGETLDLTGVNAAGIGGTVYGGGVLSLTDGSGGTLAALNIAGPYTAADFQAVSDGGTGLRDQQFEQDHFPRHRREWRDAGRGRPLSRLPGRRRQRHDRESGHRQRGRGRGRGRFGWWWRRRRAGWRAVRQRCRCGHVRQCRLHE